MDVFPMAIRRRSTGISPCLLLATVIFCSGCDQSWSQWRNKAHSRTSDLIELLPIRENGGAFEELLTVPMSPGFVWLDGAVFVGDATLDIPQPLLTVLPRESFDEFVYRRDVVARDGLDHLLVIGSDSSGAMYLFGTKSLAFYVFWHDPDEFEWISDQRDEFLQWVVRERSDHLNGCPWALFGKFGYNVPRGHSSRHQEQIAPTSVFEKAKREFVWTREYTSPDGFQLHNSKLGLHMRFLSSHGGLEQSYVELRFDQHVSVTMERRIEEFLRWLQDQGFQSH